MTQALLQLSEQTHYSEVMTLMATPLKHCPELLFLSVIESMVSLTHTHTLSWFRGVVYIAKL